MAPPVSIAVVICTLDRAGELDRALAALARQEPAEGLAWSALVVDNGSTDGTADVVEAHVAGGKIPGLRRVLEAERGLTPARRRGVRETTADWVAFVDDDNLLAPDWLAAAAEAARAHPEAGALGGRVVLEWPEPPPPYLAEFGWCFAEQAHGPAPRVVENLVGAGLMVRRAALEATGWLDGPLLADRVGRRLVSGGDVEIAQRLRAAGFALHYAPACVLRHRIERERASRRYLLAVSAGLGQSHALVSALTWGDSYAAWRRHARADVAQRARWAAGHLARAMRRRDGLTPALAHTAFAAGLVRGVAAVGRMSQAQRAALLGAAAPQAAPVAEPEGVA